MKPFVCWRKEDTSKVINPDVDALPDAYFRAVHTDFHIRIKEGEVAQFRTTTPEGLLSEILSQRDHAIVPVIGQAGTGKSHLIRWINLKLTSAPDRRKVIYVPKAQTNLRDIVLLLVRSLPLPEQQPYLAALEGAGGSYLTPEAQRTAILNQLHVALVNDPGGTNPAIDAELEGYALNGLKSMMLDPHVRSALVMDGSFSAQVAAHVFEQPDKERYEQAEERREFRTVDFPLGAGNLKKAASETQEFLSWLITATQPEKEFVASLINRHLDWAIANCLNITGDRLITLMRDIRSHLRRNHVDLFLLIEDFARLQGLDRALLQSIIEQKDDLCVLRTVFASTVGFFESIAQTVRSRTQFVVDMDAPSGEKNFSLDGFVSRYLNALRWGVAELETQWESVRGGEVTFEIASKCDQCPERTDCHSAFGAVDGVGLYPLTSTAISVMAARVDPQYQQRFNPRNFQRYVLRPVVDSGQNIAEAKFPPFRLLDNLGGRKMPELEVRRIEGLDPTAGKRRIVMLELWGGTQELKNLKAGIHEAFSIPVLANVSKIRDESGDTLSTTVESSSESGNSPPDSRLIELEQWSQGREKLSADTVNRLRPIIFRALQRFIDWDMEGLAPAQFLHQSGLMKQAQITFQNASVNPSANPFQLVIPSKSASAEEKSRVTIALQAILEADAHKSWDLPNAIQKIACVQESLDQWAQDLLRQFRALDSSPPEWATGDEAFDLLAILGVSLSRNEIFTSVDAIIRIALDETPLAPPDFVTAELNEVLKRLYDRRSDLREVVTARYSLTKGGDQGAFVDSARLLRTAASLRRRKFLPSDRSKGINAGPLDGRDPRKIAVAMLEVLPGAFATESTRRSEVVEAFCLAVGRNPSEDVVSEVIRTVSDIGGNVGVADTREMREAWAGLQGAGFVALKQMANGHEENSVGPSGIRSGVGVYVTKWALLAAALTKVLDRAEAEVTTRLSSAGVDPAEKARLLDAVTASLSHLTELLAECSRDSAS